jgi:hypothetical protein
MSTKILTLDLSFLNKGFSAVNETKVANITISSDILTNLSVSGNVTLLASDVFGLLLQVELPKKSRENI